MSSELPPSVEQGTTIRGPPNSCSSRRKFLPEWRVRNADLHPHAARSVPSAASVVGAPAVLAPSARISIAALVEAGALRPGQVLRGRGSDHHYATVLETGKLEVGGVTFLTPSGAAKPAQGRDANGWWWLVDYDGRISLSDIWNEFQARGQGGILAEDAYTDEGLPDAAVLLSPPN